MKSLYPALKGLAMMKKLAGGRLPPLPAAAGMPGASRLQEITAFGSNPGALRGWCHVPPGLPAGQPLVVVLHGCTQQAAGYDAGAGWSQLADELGFAVLLPEQRRTNNPNLCFNWFSPIDSRRDSGEALSIRQMIAAVVEAQQIDPTRVFVTGLSAGGAMASIMLATYPEVFAGGAIIAGLPFGAAASVSDAFARMAGQGYPDEAALAALVRGASAHDGPWPTISVWQGSADTTVNPTNADRIVAQWRTLHGADVDGTIDRAGIDTHRLWRNPAGQAVIEQHVIAGMGHGAPLNTHGTDSCGTAGPYMLDVGLSSTRAIARFWGLVAKTERTGATGNRPVVPESRPATATVNHDLQRMPGTSTDKGVGAIIDQALRGAGLIK